MTSLYGFEPLKWDRADLQKAYDTLATISPEFQEIAATIKAEEWVSINQALDEGRPLEEVAYAHKVPEGLVLALRHPRACLQKHDHDYQKVADCIAGKIDP